MSLPFLLEIGTEEIPDWMIPPALENLRTLFVEAGGRRSSARLWTPRRGGWCSAAAGLSGEAAGRTEEGLRTGRHGAPKQPSPASREKQGVPPEQLQREDGRYVFLKADSRPPDARNPRADALPAIIAKIYFPKTMYWTGKNGPRFIRPIRWIVGAVRQRGRAVRDRRRSVGPESRPVTAFSAQQRYRLPLTTTSRSCAKISLSFRRRASEKDRR